MKKNKQDILNILSHFQSKIKNEPPVDKMYQEVQMMNFKIKPVQGDVSIINFNNKQLIGVLWRLGKLDEFFHQEFNQLSPQQKKILIDFFPDLTPYDFLLKIEKLFLDKNKKAALGLSGIMQYRMAGALLAISGVNPSIRAGDITGNDKKGIVKTLKSLKLSAGEPRSFKEAVTAAGGVDVNEMNPVTMESKIIKNLFITGELLDIDGDSGGYNLQFAWSTGALAGMAQK